MWSDSGAFYCSRLRPARLVTYLEALETAEKEPHEDHFTVLPPRDGDVGDAESELEDVPDDLDNEYGFEAAGEFEVNYGIDEESESGDVDPYPEPSRTHECGQDILCWRKRASFDVSLDDSGLQTYFEEEFPYLPIQSPFRIWSEIFPHTLVNHIVEQTNLYAHRDCNFPAFSTGREDISSFPGVLLLSGYHHLPKEDHHWSNCEDPGVPIVSKAMIRASFRNINRHIHFADNHNLEQGNFGRHSAKMFIRGKPIRFVYTLWSLCGSDGYPYHLQVYKGKEATSSNEPLGTRVANHMVEVVRENSDVAKHHFFFEQLLHILQAPSFPTWHPRKWNYWHSEGKPDRRSKPWFDVQQSNEKEHVWNVRLSLWWHRVHVQVERHLGQLGHYCCKQLPNPLSSAWSAKACERTAGQQCPEAAPYPRLQSRNGWRWPHVQDAGIIQAIDSWEEMGLATFYECVERDCSGSMVDPLQDGWVSDVTSQLPTGDCNPFAEDVHGQPFASWRWTAGQPAWWCQVLWRRPWESGGFPRQMQGLQKIAVTCVQSAVALWPRVKMKCHLPNAQFTVSIILWSHDVFQPSDQAKHSYQRLFDSNKTNFIWTCVWKLLCQNSLYILFLYIFGSLAANVPAWEHSCISESVDQIQLKFCKDLLFANSSKCKKFQRNWKRFSCTGGKKVNIP